MKSTERNFFEGILALLVAETSREREVTEVMIKEDVMVMKCVLHLKGLYGKILEEQGGRTKDTGILLLIF